MGGGGGVGGWGEGGSRYDFMVVHVHVYLKFRPSEISRFREIDQKLCRTAQSIEFRKIPRNQ